MDSLKMYPRPRSLVLFVVALALIFALPGCSGLAGLGQEPVELTFVYFENAADYEPLAESFHEKYPNITIKLAPVSAGGDSMRSFETLAETADAIRVSSTLIDADIVKAFLPLDTYITTDKNFPQEDLFSGSLEGLKVDGKQVGLPAALNPYVVFYEPGKFEARGVTPPAAGWTVEDFMTSAMAINNTDEALVGTEDYTFGFCSAADFGDPLIIAYMFGGGVFDNVNSPTTATLNSPANIESLDWYASLRNEFGVMPESTVTSQVGQLIVRSNCGFWMDWLDRSSFGRWMGDRNLSALPLPSYGSPFSLATLDSYSIMATSLHPDETWKWLRYIMEQPTASGNLVPPLRSIISTDEYTNHAARDVLSVARAMSQETLVLGVEMYQDERLGMVLGLYSSAAAKVLNKDMDAMTALDLAQQEANKAFGQ